MNEPWREREVSKTPSLQPNTHMCVFLRVSISHPRTRHWDPWPIGEAGLWKSRNLGIGFWQRVCWHGDRLLQLPWMWMTWVLFPGRERFYTQRNIRMHKYMYGMSSLPSWISKNWTTALSGHNPVIWCHSSMQISLFGWAKSTKYINCHNTESAAYNNS